MLRKTEMMNLLGRLGLVLAIVAMAAAVDAQERERGRGRGFGGFRGGSLTLATQKSVQDELKVTPEQVTKLTALVAEQRKGFEGLRNLSQDERTKKFTEARQAAEKALAEVLNADQLKRVKQISWQQMGTAALSDDEVAATLSLNDEQKGKLKTIRDDSRKEMQGLFQGGGQGGDREQRRAKFAELRKSTDEKATAVLTPEQQAKWKELQGAAFTGEITFGRGGGRRGGGGNN